MRTRLPMIAAAVILPALLVSVLPAQEEEGALERLGSRIDRGLAELSDEVQRAWSDVRKSVDQLEVRGRVYGRLRWDKALAEAPIEIAVGAENVVTLSGHVPNEKARQKAVQLAEETVGVREVIDRLQVKPAAQPTNQSPDR